MENFESFLTGKKIDPVRFKKGDPDRHKEFSELFEVMHPNSFVSQKLFLINAIRRKFPLKAGTVEGSQKPKNIQVKPKITPKIKK